MKLVTVKTADEASQIAGAIVDYTHENGSLTEIRVGGLVIKKATEYGQALVALKVQQFEEATRYLVHGEIVGIKVEEFFEDWGEANTRARKLNEGVVGAPIELTDNVKVLVREDGTVVRRV